MQCSKVVLFALFRSIGRRVDGGSFKCSSVVHLLPDGEFRFAVEREYWLNDA